MIEIHPQLVNPQKLHSLIFQSLPDQGNVEVQRDVPGKEHFWHTHKKDETIVVLDGELRFYWDEGEEICNAGDVISLPAGTRHGSVATDGGATYLIAFHKIVF
ncbi:MAG: cupin domain-containing protein [Rhizobiales bacterium]|nr:cupin domain-containing protein [Hyphomicrobiales bacterium]